MAAAGSGSTSITNNAPPLRVWDANSPTIYIYGNYKKNDPNVNTLKIILKDINGNIITQDNIDVSQVAVGNTVQLNRALANSDLGTVQATADQVQDDTVPADGSKTYTAPADHYLFIEDVDGALVAEGFPSNWSKASNQNIKGFIVSPGASITIDNPDSTSHAVRIYYVPSNEVNMVDRVLEFEEQDANGNTLYSNSITVGDLPLVQVIVPSAGEITINAIG